MIFIECPGLYRSGDLGRSWTQVFDRGIVVGILLDEAQPLRALLWTSYFGTGSLYQSVDDGGQWRDLGVPGAPRDVELAPDGGSLYAATDTGLFRRIVSGARLVGPR